MVKNRSHFPVYLKPGAVEPHTHGSRLQFKNLSHLLGSQFFHIVEDKHDSQRRWNSQYCLMQQIVPLGM